MKNEIIFDGAEDRSLAEFWREKVLQEQKAFVFDALEDPQRLEALRNHRFLVGSGSLDIREQVEEVFHQLQEPRTKHDYRFSLGFLSASGLIETILLEDWSVDRDASAEESLGISSFGALEQTLIDKYYGGQSGVMTHLHKGPGKGNLMKRLRQEGRCHQVGIGLTLCQTLDPFLENLANQEVLQLERERKFLKVLAFVLKKALKEKSLTMKGNFIGKIQKRVPFVDLNEIFRILTVEGDFSRWLNVAKKDFQENEFEGERSLDVENVFLQFLSKLFRGNKRKELLEDTDRLKNQWIEKIVILVVLSTEVNSHDPAHILESYWEEWRMKYFNATKEEVPEDTTVEEFKEKIERKIKEFDEKCYFYESLLELRFWKEGVDVRAFLDCIFDDTFSKGLFHANYYGPNADYSQNATYPGTKERIVDLNRYPDVHLEGFIPGRFVEIPKKIPKNLIGLMTSTKGDTHESDEEFERDVRGNLEVLAPGGVLLTQGVVQSYTRILRFKEILKAIRESGEMAKVEIVVCRSTEAPLAVLIQKYDERGYLTDEDKEKFLGDAYCESMEDFMRRPLVALMERIRERIFAAADGDEYIFRDLKKKLNLDEEISNTLKDVLMYVIQNSPEILAQYKSLYDKGEGEVALNLELHNSGEQRLLGENEVKAAMEIVEARIFDALVSTGRVKRMLKPGSLEVLSPTTIYTFKNLRMRGSLDEQRMYNDVSVCERLASNSEFLTEKNLGRIDRRRRQILKDFDTLQKRGMKKPLKVITFSDCVHNEILVEQLAGFLGEDNFRRFGLRMDVDLSTFNNDGEFSSKFRDLLEEGGIFISGGSFYNAFDPEGEEYKAVATRPLFKKYCEGDRNLRILNICFSLQQWADVAGEHFTEQYHDRVVEVIPGALEFGPTPIKLPKRTRNQRFFRGFPPNFTAAMTHSSHVSLDNKGNGIYPVMVPLAYSGLTNLPIAWADDDSRVVSVQFHPEVSLVNACDKDGHVERIIEELRKFESQIRGSFGVGVDDLQENWKLRNADGKPRVTADIWDLFIANTLFSFAKDLVFKK